MTNTTLEGQSVVTEVGAVAFPPWRGEGVYMLKFLPGELPAQAQHWAQAIEEMLQGVDFKHGFLTIDERVVLRGRAQRRPGLHIDGSWDDGTQRHRPSPGHHHSQDEQLLVLASSVEGCVGYEGEFELEGFNWGDCATVPRASLVRRRMRAGIAYSGGASSFLHESLPVPTDCRRTMIRLNLVVQG